MILRMPVKIDVDKYNFIMRRSIIFHVQNNSEYTYEFCGNAVLYVCKWKMWRWIRNKINIALNQK